MQVFVDLAMLEKSSPDPKLGDYTCYVIVVVDHGIYCRVSGAWYALYPVISKLFYAINSSGDTKQQWDLELFGGAYARFIPIHGHLFYLVLEAVSISYWKLLSCYVGLCSVFILPEYGDIWFKNFNQKITFWVFSLAMSLQKICSACSLETSLLYSMPFSC